MEWTTANTIASLSFAVATFSIIFAIYNSRRFAYNPFVNKQVEIIVDLVRSLHTDRFEVNFKPNSGNAFGYTMQATLFELPDNQIDIEQFPGRDQAPVYFSHRSNQLLNISKFINDPLLPISIAEALLAFYSNRVVDIEKETVSGKKVIIITSNHYVDTVFPSDKANTLVYKQSNGAAFKSWQDLINSINHLESSISQFLKKYKVKEINIRKDPRHIYF
jgi:hypothetical protein